MLQQNGENVTVPIEMAVGPADDTDFADAQHGEFGAGTSGA
jgi:hypothetical protein